LVDARNQADAIIHATEKSLKEFGEKLEAGEKEKIEKAIEELREAMKGDDKDAIEQKTQAVAEASHKLAEQMYAKAQEAAGGEETETEGKRDEDVVDAEFEEVKDEKK
ncbi:MAG TPA: Hsp70 family protein, partial [Gammaproteobacteria bacterium]